MNSLLKNNQFLLVLFHLVIGVLIAFLPISKIYGISIILFGIYWIINNNNENEEALIMSAYLVGAEVFLRMTNGVFLYETGKYGVFLFLFIGFAVGKNKIVPNPLYVIYILLILLGIAFTRVPEGESIRKAIAFNLSGPFILGVSAIYFYYRNINYNQLIKSVFSSILPLISMVIYLYFKTPSLSEIKFTGVANFEASGGFGPNQVSTILGYGVFVIAFLMILQKKITGIRILDFIILLYFLFRALITFSRGGVLSSIIISLVFLIFYLFYIKQGFKIFLKIIGVSFVFSLGIWLYTSEVTGGMLINRYTGRNAKGVLKEDLSSGRSAIFQEQLNSFYESPLVGIGVGNGKFKRNENDEDLTAASHNEIGRLIEEHGLIGIFSFLLLFFSPLPKFFRSNYLQKGIILSFFLFYFFTISHSAMRIAFPGFIYALCLANYIPDEQEV